MQFNKYLRPILTGTPGAILSEEVGKRLGQSGTAVLEAMQPLLNGQHSTAEVYARLNLAEFRPDAIWQTLEVLESFGFLAEAPANHDGELSAEALKRYARQIELFDSWWEEDSSVSGPQTKGCRAQAKLGLARVLVVGLATAGSRLAENLAAAGVGTLVGIHARALNGDTERPTEATNLAATMAAINPSVKFNEVHDPQFLAESMDDEPVSLIVYCPDEFDPELCILLNRLALDTSVPFLIYRPSSSHVEVGPLIVPRETACYICCDLRRKVALGGPPLDELCPGPSCGFNFSIGVDLLSIEAVKVLTQIALPVCRGKIWRLDLRSGLSEVHPVLKLPRCVACGVHRKAPSRKLWEYIPSP